MSDTVPNRSTIRVQVRYSETDAMKFVYYANYLVYFEVARTSALADLGFPYWEMEKNGVLIPVLEARCEYVKAGRYGDNLLIRTTRWRSGAPSNLMFAFIVRSLRTTPAPGDLGGSPAPAEWPNGLGDGGLGRAEQPCDETCLSAG